LASRLTSRRALLGLAGLARGLIGLLRRLLALHWSSGRLLCLGSRRRRRSLTGLALLRSGLGGQALVLAAMAPATATAATTLVTARAFLALLALLAGDRCRLALGRRRSDLG
jgi:hypothetical protein